MIISLLTVKICKRSLHSYIDDDSKNVNSNSEVTKLTKAIYSRETYFYFGTEKQHDHSKEIERECYKIFGTSLICELDFTLIKMLKISALNYANSLTYSPKLLSAN